MFATIKKHIRYVSALFNGRFRVCNRCAHCDHAHTIRRHYSEAAGIWILDCKHIRNFVPLEGSVCDDWLLKRTVAQ